MRWKIFFKGMKQGQKAFGEDIAQVINLFLLTIVYLIGIGLTSIFAKTFRKHFLDIEINRDKESYWEELNLEKKEMGEYYRQF